MITSEFTTQIQEALKQPEMSIWAIAKDFLDRGYSHEELLNQLESLRAGFRDLNLEAEEDRVMDLMDCFYGWCASQWDLRKR